MYLKFLRLFEDFTEGKFSIEDVERCRREGKRIYASVVKDFPKNDPDQELEIVDIDKNTGEITVMVDNNIYYVDLKNVERIEK